MPAPTITHITAADGSKLTVTTRESEPGVLSIRVFRGPDRHTAAPVMRGDFSIEVPRDPFAPAESSEPDVAEAHSWCTECPAAHLDANDHNAHAESTGHRSTYRFAERFEVQS